MKKFLLTALGLTGVLGMSSGALADSLHYYPNGYTSASNLKYYSYPSVASFGYTSIADDAASSWNNISSKVAISKSTTASNSNQITVDVLDSISGMDVYGVADYYINGYYGWEPVTLPSIRDRTTLRFDHSNLDAWYRLLSDTDKKDAFIHEFGHALSLSHNDDVSPSVMKSSKPWVGGPQTTDKNHLKQKWGN
jgi:hypothetical protein